MASRDTHPQHDERPRTPDALAKRLFVLTVAGVLAYVGVVLALMVAAN